MSGQSAKKKRLGSRRAASRPKEAAESDEFHVAGSDSAAQQHVAEDRTEAAGATPKPDEFRLETQQPIPVNRKKLGSSRRHKGKQHGKDSDIDTCPEMREEVEESSRGLNTSETTQMSEAAQLESQKEICEGSQLAISAPLKTSPTICPEEALESLGPQNQNKLQSFQNEKMAENPHEDGTFQLTSQSVLSYPSVDTQLVNISPLDFMGLAEQGLSHPDSVDETESNKTFYTDLFAESTHSQGSSLIRDSFEESVLDSKTLEITADRSSAREIVEVKQSLEQPMLSSLKDEVVATEEQNVHFNLFEERYAPHPEEIVDNRLDNKTQDRYRKEFFPHSQTLHPPEDVSSGQAGIMNIPDPQSSKQGHQIKESNDEVSGNLKTIMSSTREEKNEELSEGGKHDSSMFSESGNQVAVSDQSVEDTPKGKNESDTPESEEVKGYHYSVDDVRNKLEEEVKPTQTEEAVLVFNTSERVPNDAADSDDSEMISEPVTDETEVIDTYRPGVVVKGAVGSATNREDSHLDWKQDENHGEVGHLDESRSLDSSSCIDEQTEAGFGQSENGSMLGSSYSDEGRQQIKESEVKLSDNDDSGETMPLTTETQKDESLFKEYEAIPSVPHGSPVFSASTIGYPSEHQNPLAKNFPHTEMESAIPECRNILDQDMRETGLKTEASDKSEETKLDYLDSSDPLEKERHLTLERKGEGYSVDDSKQPWINYSEIGDLTLGHVYDDKDQLDNDVKHSAEKSVSQETGIFDIEKSHFSSQTSPSQQNISSDSKHQDISPSANEQTETDFDPRRNRRKLGSSRRIKDRQELKKSNIDAAENTNEPDTPETMIMSLTPESRQDVAQQSEPDTLSASHSSSVISISTPDYSSEVLSTPLTNYSETDLQSFIPHGQHFKGDLDDGFTGGVIIEGLFNKSEKITMEDCDTSVILGPEEARGGLHNREEDQPQIEKMNLIPDTFNSMLDGADDNSQMISGDLKEAQIKSAGQYDVMAKSPPDSAAKQKHSDPDDPQVEHYTKESNLEPPDQKNEDDPLHSARSDEEGQHMSSDYADVVKGDLKTNTEEIFHREKEELFSETEANNSCLEKVYSETPFDAQPQENAEAESSFDDFGNTRKLASNLRHKETERFEVSVTESYGKPIEGANAKTAGEEPSGTTELLPTEQTKGWIASVETIMEGTDKCDPAQTEEENVGGVVCTSGLTTVDLFANPSEDKQVIDQSERRQMLHDEHSSVASAKDEGIDKLLKQEGIFQEYSLTEPYVGPTKVAISTENSSHEEQTEPETVFTDISANTSQPEIDIKSTDIQMSSDLDNQQVLSEQNTFEAVHHEHDIRKKETDGTERVYTGHQDNKGHFSTLQENNPDPSPGVNQGILGSSQDGLLVTLQEEMDKTGSAASEYVTVDAKQNAHFSGIAPLSECTNPAVDRQLIKSNSSEVPDEGLPALYSVSENRETVKDTQMLKLAEQFLGIDPFMDVDSEYGKSSMTAEIFSEKNNPRKHEVRCSVEQEAFSSPKEEIAKNREPKEQFGSSEVRETQQSDGVVNKLQKDHTDATQIQVMHQITYPAALEDKPLLQTLETNIYLDSPLQSINDEIHTDIKPAGNKRRLGSSRRSKGRQQVKEETSEPQPETTDHAEATKVDESLKIAKMSLTTEAAVQEESDNLNFAEDATKSGSTESEDTEKLSEEDMFFTQNVMITRASETPDFISNSDSSASLKPNADTEENKTPVEEPENIGGLTGSDIDDMNLFQTAHVSAWRGESDMQNISSHDDNSSFTPRTKDVVDQKEASQTQNTEVLTCDSDSPGHKIYVEETETCAEVAGSSMDVQGLEEDEAGRKREDPANEFKAAQGIYTSPQIVSAAQEPAVDVSSSTELSTEMDASNNSESERSNSGYCEIVPAISRHKKRKLGSTRKNQLSRRQEKDKVQEGTTETESDVRNLVEIEVVEQLQVCAEMSQNEDASLVLSLTHKELQEISNPPSAHDEEREQQGNTADVQSSDSNVRPDINDSLDLSPQQSASHNVSIVSPANDADVRVGEMDINVTVQPAQTPSPEIQVTSERNRQETENAAITDVARESLMLHSESAQVTHREEKPESVEVTQDPKNDPQNRDSDELESTHFNEQTKTNRRRKMGSSRRNLVFQAKGEELQQKQEEDTKATESQTPDRSATAITVPGFEEQELQLHTEDRHHHSEEKEEIILETVECTHVHESQLKPLVQQTAPQSQPEETEHQLFDSGCSPSTTDTMSELASGGRRRKMGSHRKSRGHQNQKDQSRRVMDAGDERRVRSITEATEEQTEEPSGRDHISEVDGRQTTPSPSFSDPLRPLSEKTPSQPHGAGVALNQESQTQLSLAGNPRGKELKSNNYNVVMIGDSGVGKTSFMKRAQSGKFSLILPTSIGLDSCMWTVVVEGNPVVLHVWDTAGQERFRSITRQVFHRAQGFLLMYDISSAQSFSAVSYWASCIQESSAENVAVLLLGNKTDCADRKVTAQQGDALAKEYNFEFMECSAATGENVVQSLESIARMVSQRCDSRREATVLHKGPEKKKGSRCC
ncbi:uncharacterized protein rab44 [Salarias fasciatus]|uniref:Uncharacterized LOC115388585 n=1 Tax=Salarias fasciatus TaxID=181472 RepID=A0A672GVZ2_SALFA|nr:uncharacterized protein LOC115388585 [Salarias fasciatus]XP_029947631.1 uncharacterized protein LOC115388585 [Salarias fasciatus]